MPDMTPLFDTLAGAAGHPVNRPGLNAFVANSQALNGLRSAQTEEALLKAQEAQEEQAAAGQLEGALGDMMGPGHEADARAASMMMRGHFGNSKQALDAILGAQEFKNRSVLGDPNQLNTPAQTAAQQGVQGKVAEPVATPKEFTTLPGITPPTVQQTPLGKADTVEAQNKAALLGQQATHPELFHTGSASLTPQQSQDVAEFIRLNPNLASNIRALISNGGSQVVHAFLHPDEAAPPSPAPGPGGAPSAPGTAPTPPNGITPAPGVSLKEQADVRHAFASGVESRQVGSLNTMVLHSQLFDQIAEQLQNGNFTPSNAIANKWQQLFGSPVPGNLKIAADFLGREAVRATVNAGAGTGSEREFQVGTDASPDMLHGAAQTLRSLAGGQLRSLDLRARRGGVDISQMLGPEAQQTFGVGGGHGPAQGPLANTPGATPAAPAPPPAAVISQLKEGVVTEFGNGQKWTLKGGQPVLVP